MLGSFFVFVLCFSYFHLQFIKSCVSIFFYSCKLVDLYLNLHVSFIVHILCGCFSLLSFFPVYLVCREFCKFVIFKVKHFTECSEVNHEEQSFVVLSLYLRYTNIPCSVCAVGLGLALQMGRLICLKP